MWVRVGVECRLNRKRTTRSAFVGSRVKIKTESEGRSSRKSERNVRWNENESRMEKSARTMARTEDKVLRRQEGQDYAASARSCTTGTVTR